MSKNIFTTQELAENFYLQKNTIETYRIIKAIGFDDILFPSPMLNENIDWNFIKLEGNKYASQIASLIKLIVKKGSKVLYNKMKMFVKKTHQYIQENKQPYNKRTIVLGLKSLIWALSFILLECGEHSILNNPQFNEYNYQYENGHLIINSDGKTYTVSNNGGKPTIQQKKQIEQQFPGYDKMSDNKSPILCLEKGEKIPEYHASPEIKKAIAQAEGFVDHIYDTKDTRHRMVNPKDMKSNKDLTIGYGHKLTKLEKQTWKYNKTITQEEAYQLFLKDFGAHEKSALDALKTLPYYNQTKFSQGFIDGIVSIRYNSSPKLAFGRPNWVKKGQDTFWERMQKCRIDTKNKCINYNDFVYALPLVKKLYAPSNSNMGGLPIRRNAEYNIMMQKYGEINPQLYNLKK